MARGNFISAGFLITSSASARLLLMSDLNKHCIFFMIVTTTPNIEGKQIVEYLGIVSSQTIIGANFFKDILAGLRDFFGGRSGAYERVLDEAKQFAMNELVLRAKSIGANAVVGIDMDYETVGAHGSMLMVCISGTAVRFQ